MSAGTIIAICCAYGLIGLFSSLSRLNDTSDECGSVCCGVLWPVYVPYRLFLIIRGGEA